MQLRAREWFVDVVESIPSLVFVALLRLGVELEMAGWIGAALAATVLIGLPTLGARYNPILLGINVHLLAVTPLIVAVFRLGAAELGETLTHYSYQGVLVTIFVVGLVLTLSSRQGFVGTEGSPSIVRRQSFVLLIATLSAIGWAFAWGGDAIVGVALPIIGLFVLRRVVSSERTSFGH